MTTAATSPLEDHEGLLPGNLAKVRVVCELSERLRRDPAPLTVLDVGCVGVEPFNQWRYLFRRFPGRIQLTGIDVRGLDRAAAVARQEGWDVRLVPLSGYDMASLGTTFDVVVATQVLEHVRRRARFLEQLAAVLAPGAPAYLTIDSAHFAKQRDLREWVRDLVARFVSERWHDVGLSVDEVRALVPAAGLRIEELRLHNLGPLKRIHNHQVGAAERDGFLRSWYEMEDALNRDAAFLAQHPDHFAGIYVKAVRVSAAGA
jgi:2-polyprenyl-3-methyl-5-hydroxy-6-metoxy-1,4-benzoquinol methylase